MAVKLKAVVDSLCGRARIGWVETTSLWRASPGGAAASGRPPGSRSGAKCLWWTSLTVARWASPRFLHGRDSSLQQSTRRQSASVCLLAGGCAPGGHPGSLRQPVHHQGLCHGVCPQHHDQLCAGAIGRANSDCYCFLSFSDLTSVKYTKTSPVIQVIVSQGFANMWYCPNG